MTTMLVLDLVFLMLLLVASSAWSVSPTTCCWSLSLSLSSGATGCVLLSITLAAERKGKVVGKCSGFTARRTQLTPLSLPPPLFFLPKNPVGERSLLLCVCMVAGFRRERYSGGGGGGGQKASLPPPGNALPPSPLLTLLSLL